MWGEAPALLSFHIRKKAAAPPSFILHYSLLFWSSAGAKLFHRQDRIRSLDDSGTRDQNRRTRAGNFRGIAHLHTAVHFDLKLQAALHGSIGDGLDLPQ